MASYFLVSARVRAAEGISNAPGTRTISMSFGLRAASHQSVERALQQSFGDEGVEARDHDGEALSGGVEFALKGLDSIFSRRLQSLTSSRAT